jgi:anti-sigma-K factor RskA
MTELSAEEIDDLLVAYALGLLDADELARVQDLLAVRPELREQLAQLRATADVLPYALPASQPPPELRQKALDFAVGRRISAAPQQEKRQNLPWRLLSAFGTALAVAMIGFALLLGQLNGSRSQLVVLETQLATAQAGREEVAAVLAQPQLVAALEGASGSGNVLVGSNGQTLLAVQLPPLAAEQVYQFWVIAGDNAPVSAGVFRVDERGYALVTLPDGAVAPATTLAITAEPAPGSPGPTGEILILGQAPA